MSKKLKVDIEAKSFNRKGAGVYIILPRVTRCHFTGTKPGVGNKSARCGKYINRSNIWNDERRPIRFATRCNSSVLTSSRDVLQSMTNLDLNQLVETRGKSSPRRSNFHPINERDAHSADHPDTLPNPTK